jgi:hypothetical protein
MKPVTGKTSLPWTNQMTTVNQQMSKTELRKFGIITGFIFAVLFGLLFPWLAESSIPYWPFIVAGVLVIWGLLHPGSLKPVYAVWMKIGHVLGWINTRIILAVLFYLIFMPVGLVMRMFGVDFLKKKLEDSKTYRVESAQQSKDHIERPY